MMTARMILLITLISPFFLFAQITHDVSKYSYVGVSGCVTCHKTEKQGKQLDIWKNSAHAKAYETLKTAASDSIAKSLGHTTPAVETDACLSCHAPEYSVDKSRLGEKFAIEDGVQCETCHGPGSEYKSLKIMKDTQLSIENGLYVVSDLNEFCAKCHNADSPTFVDRDATLMWEEIKHPVPGKSE